MLSPSCPPIFLPKPEEVSRTLAQEVVLKPCLDGAEPALFQLEPYNSIPARLPAEPSLRLPSVQSVLDSLDGSSSSRLGPDYVHSSHLQLNEKANRLSFLLGCVLFCWDVQYKAGPVEVGFQLLVVALTVRPHQRVANGINASRW